ACVGGPARGSAPPAEGRRSGPGLRQALETAQGEAQRLHDEYISTEHLLLGIAGGHGSAAARALADADVTLDGLYRAIQEVRGSQRGPRANPAPKSQARATHAPSPTPAPAD